ncbi:D-glycero-alpha-D-manno-heptose-1,7-bisphosphate 7-phosphatase [candidate division KSB1 bacterium]
MIVSRNRIGVFLDRDGTISQEIGYILEINKFSLYDYSVEAIKKLNSLGVKVIVVTNQACVARGLCSEDTVQSVNQRMINLLKSEGAFLDDVFFCPHHIEGTVDEYTIDCPCRKPKIGMISEAVSKNDIEVTESFVVGDKISDIQMGFNAGTRTILLLTGHGRNALNEIKNNNLKMPHFIAENLLEASDIIYREVQNLYITA